MSDLSVSSNMKNATQLGDHICQTILYVELGNTRIRAWDVIILIPNLLFLIFLTIRFNRARLKLRATSSPIFITFYGLVVVNVVVSLARCLAAMAISTSAFPVGNTEKILWVVVRFFLLSTEMSVVIFCLAFGHLDSRSSTRYVLLATSLLSLAFSTTQGVLELAASDPDSQTIPEQHLMPSLQHIFHHGGLVFWMSASLLFTMVYLIVLVLPWTRIRDRLVLPTKHSFYVYIFVLMILNLMQTIGSVILNYGEMMAGLCVIDVTSVLYFTLYTPLVYYSFLAEFFSIAQPSILFSYKAQVDDLPEDDNVSLPHQQSFSSLKTDSDYIYQSNSVYDSTHFDRTNNALYVASLQSPDSLPDSSIASTASLQLHSQ